MTNPSKKVLFKRLLFLELTGILSLVLAVGALILLISLKMVETKNLIIPSAGFLVVFLFIFLSVRYARRDIHKIHELHAKGFYRIGRILVYGIGLAMIGYTLFLFATNKDIFDSIGSIIEAEVILVLGVLIIYYTYMIAYLIENEHLRHEHANFWDIFWVIIFPVMLIAGTIYMLFSQTADTVSSGKADFELAPSAIIAEFQKNDSLAKNKYGNKIIRFSSHILEISGDSSILMKLDGGMEGVTINCGFDKSQKEKVSDIIVGDSIQLQCSCSGFVKPTDESSLLSEVYVEMTRCNLLKHVVIKPRVGTDIESPKVDSTKNK
jgi:tRNA_anti-like